MKVILSCAAAALLACPAPGTAGRLPAPAERAELIMGTVARVAIVDGPRDAATYEAGFEALRAVDRAMSLYRPDSDLVRVNAHAGRHAEPLPDDLFALLVRARELSALTEGAFDPTVLPLLLAWGAYADLAHLEAGDPAAVGFPALLLDPGARSARFLLPGMALDLGGIAKGWALDRARTALAARGVRQARLDLGGNLAFVGDGLAPGWEVAVRDPARPAATFGVVALPAASAVATSANYARDFAAEGWRAPSHVYDPRTRRPVLSRLAVTVWAPDATTADALSTALLVLGPTAAPRVLARVPGAGALFADGRDVAVYGHPPRAWRPWPSATMEEP